MASKISSLIGFGAGAGLMYILDPDLGRRRRAVAGDKTKHFARVTGRTMTTTARDLKNRTRGLFIESRKVLQHESIADDILVDRVRAQLGRFVSHPHAVEVSARDGVVTLSGKIPIGEVAPLLSAMAKVRGVKDVVDKIEPHEASEAGRGESDLHSRHAGELPLAPWPDSVRLATGLAGAGLALLGWRSKSLLGVILGSSGLILGGRALIGRDSGHEDSRSTGGGVPAGRSPVGKGGTEIARAPEREEGEADRANLGR